MKDHIEWRANWHKSEYKTLTSREARKRAHSIALSLGTVTGVLWASALVYILN